MIFCVQVGGTNISGIPGNQSGSAITKRWLWTRHLASLGHSFHIQERPMVALWGPSSSSVLYGSQLPGVGWEAQEESEASGLPGWTRMRGLSGWAGAHRSQWRERRQGRGPGRAELGAGAGKRGSEYLATSSGLARPARLSQRRFQGPDTGWGDPVRRLEPVTVR